MDRHPWANSAGPPEYTHDREDKAALLYKAVYEEAKRGLDAQSAELDSLRQRAIMFLAFVSSATAFLVGTTLDAGGVRNGTFRSVAIWATAVSAAAIVAAVATVVPWRKWQGKLSAATLIEGWVETDTAATEVFFYRELALLFDEMRMSNETTLAILRSLYTALILAGSAQVVLWASLAWIRA